MERIIENVIKKKLGKNFLLFGEIPNDATINQIAAIVIDNGIKVNGISEEKSGTDVKGVEEEKEEKPGSAGYLIPEDDNYANSEDSENEEKDKKKVVPIPIGKCAKIGTSLLAASILIGALATLTVTKQEKNIKISDYQIQQEVSDTILTEIDGQQIRYVGSVIPNPGKLIHDQRDSAIGEQNGTYSGVQEYFKTSTDESRIAEEEEIIQIAKAFDEQQEKISKAQQVIQNPKATDVEKYQAFKEMKSAKQEQYNIYEKNVVLYNKYNKMDEIAHSKNGGDERTEDEIALGYIGSQEYNLAMQNLFRDTASIGVILATIDTPEQLFKEKAPIPGTTEKEHLLETEIWGHPVNFWELKEIGYCDVNYEMLEKVTEGHQVGEGVYTLSAKQITDMEVEYKNVSAVAKIVEDLVEKNELGEISVFGHTVYEDRNDKEK